MLSMLSMLLVLSLLNACSYTQRILPPQKVACCEEKAQCCFEHMCCLPRYAKEAGVQPKAFTPEAPVYGSGQDLEPLPGEVTEEPGWFSRLNPFRSSDEKPTSPPPEPTTAKQEDRSFLGRLWPF